jgi:hypothetical protein
MLPPVRRDPEPGLQTSEDLRMVCRQLLDMNEALLHQTRRNVWRGSYDDDEQRFRRRYRSLVFEVLDFIQSEGAVLRLERHLEQEAGVSRLERPSDVINAICDLAESDMNMVEREHAMEPATLPVNVWVHRLIEVLYFWQVLHP